MANMILVYISIAVLMLCATMMLVRKQGVMSAVTPAYLGWMILLSFLWPITVTATVVLVVKQRKTERRRKAQK